MARWSDIINKFVGNFCTELANNREKWRKSEEAYTLQRVERSCCWWWWWWWYHKKSEQWTSYLSIQANRRHLLSIRWKRQRRWISLILHKIIQVSVYLRAKVYSFRKLVLMFRSCPVFYDPCFVYRHRCFVDRVIFDGCDGGLMESLEGVEWSAGCLCAVEYMDFVARFLWSVSQK